MRIIVRGTFAQRKSFRGDCLVGEIPGGNCPGGDFIGGNLPGRSCPERNYSGAIVWVAKVLGVTVLGGISWGAIVRMVVFQKGNYSLAIVLGVKVRGGIVLGGISWGTIV